MAKVILEPIGVAREQSFRDDVWRAQLATDGAPQRRTAAQARRGARRLGRRVPRARSGQGQVDHLGADRAAQGRRQSGPADRDAGQLRAHLRPRGADLARRRCRHGVRCAFTGAGSSSSPTTTRWPPDPGGPRPRRRSSAPRRSVCACGCRWSTWSTARGCYLPEQSNTFPGRTGAGAIFRMNSLALRGRRAADRRRARGLHRRRRLHADHQRRGLHDRAGLHGHRRRRADQGRQVDADHLADDRRSGRPRAPLALRRPSRSRRRGAADARPRGGLETAGTGVRLLPLRGRGGPAALRRGRAGRPVPDGSPHGLRHAAGAGPSGRQLAVLGGAAAQRAGDDLWCRPRQRALRRLHRQQPRADRPPRRSETSSGRAGSSTARGSPRSRSSRGPATTTAFPSSGFRTSRDSTSESRRKSRGCWATAPI